MCKFKILFISVGICLLWPAISVWAGWFGADFSAEVVQGTTQGQSVRGKMYVGQGRVRTEMKQNDQLLIEIIDPGKGQAWMLDEGRKVYRQRAVPKVSVPRGDTHSPCDGVEGTDCRQMPDELLNGRNARKWLLRIKGKERQQWHDSVHDFPIQVVESGQVIMAKVFIGAETLNGRPVERWRTLQQNDKTVVENEQWYDPQLNIAIRQVAKDGSFRELRNIQLGAQADALFELPQGYRKLEAPAR